MFGRGYGVLGGFGGQDGSFGAWLGGPGEVKALLDDGGDPGPGEEEQEKRTDEWIRRRLIMMEETMVRRGRDGQEKGGRGGWG